jgi:hypothetical protein
VTKRLKLRIVGGSLECFVAIEYESDTYFSYASGSKIPSITWQSSPHSTEAVIGLLRERGWHTTDIGDELDEARIFTPGAA